LSKVIVHLSKVIVHLSKVIVHLSKVIVHLFKVIVHLSYMSCLLMNKLHWKQASPYVKYMSYFETPFCV